MYPAWSLLSDASPSGWVFLQQQPLVVPDVQREDRWPNIVQLLRARPAAGPARDHQRSGVGVGHPRPLSNHHGLSPAGCSARILELQPKLLRALQEHEFERLGGTGTIQVDVRLLAATNRDLVQMIGERQFRTDLYYRLSVFPLSVPPLRERTGDIPKLVRYFTQKYSRLMNKRVENIPSDALDALVRYGWPGNVRELENLIERSVILSRGAALQIPLAELRAVPSAAAPVTLREAERDHIRRVLEKSNWVVGGPNRAAARLGMKRTTLQSKMKKLGISR